MKVVIAKVGLCRKPKTLNNFITIATDKLAINNKYLISTLWSTASRKSKVKRTSLQDRKHFSLSTDDPLPLYPVDFFGHLYLDLELLETVNYLRK